MKAKTLTGEVTGRAVLFILGLTFFINSAAHPQQDHFNFSHLTIDDGLSQSAVYALMQDRQGFVWIGTKDGLNRYDGYNFTVYKNIPSDSTSLSNNYITALFEDRRGAIWVGTREGGLNRLDPASGTFRRFMHSPDDSGSISNNRISSLAEDHLGALWIATDDGLNRLSREQAAQARPNFEKFFHAANAFQSLSGNIVKPCSSMGRASCGSGRMAVSTGWRRGVVGNRASWLTMSPVATAAPG